MHDSRISTPQPGWALMTGWVLSVYGGYLFLTTALRLISAPINPIGPDLWGLPLWRPLFIPNLMIGCYMLILGICLLRGRTLSLAGPRRIAWMLLTQSAVLFALTAYNHIMLTTNLSPFLSVHLLCYGASGVLVPIIILWYVHRFEKFKHPDVNTLIYIMTATGIIVLSMSLVRLVASSQQTAAFQWHLFISGFLILFAVLLLVGAAVLLRHPNYLHKLQPIGWILLVLFGIYLVIPMLSMWWDSRWDAADYLRYLADTILTGKLFCLLPVILMITLPGRSRHSFRLAKKYKHGFDFCSRCGYDLAGNTKGQCPECGKLFLHTLHTDEPEPASEADTPSEINVTLNEKRKLNVSRG